MPVTLTVGLLLTILRLLRIRLGVRVVTGGLRGLSTVTVLRSAV